MAAAATILPAAIGHRLLCEIEDTNLEEVLRCIRTGTDARPQDGGSTTGNIVAQYGGFSSKAHNPSTSAVESLVRQQHTPVTSLCVPAFPIPALQQLVTRHFCATRGPEVVVGGSQPLALVYLLIAALVGAHHHAVVVVDVEARFDVQHLLHVQPVLGNDVRLQAICEDDLQHVHVFRTGPQWRAPLTELVAAAEQRVLYGTYRRRDRPLWGTVVIGGARVGAVDSTTRNNDHEPDSTFAASLNHGTGAAFVTGYYGWLRVDILRQDRRLVQQERQRQLLALFETINPSSGISEAGKEENSARDTSEYMKGECLGNPPGELPIIDRDEAVTWIASSLWGDFTFKLCRP